VKRKNLLSLALALLTAIALSIAFAAVFSYYPVSIAISPVSPPVYFEPGSNANTSDLGANNTIAVTVGRNKTSVSITIHPTYQVTYYKNVTLIVNSDSKAYNISLRVVTVATDLPPGASAVVYVYSKSATRSLSGYLSGYPPTLTPSGYVKNVSLTSTGTTLIGSLSGGSAYEIDIYVYIPEGTSLPSSSISAELLLIASPSSESPP
jgi:hypothetical protein